MNNITLTALSLLLLLAVAAPSCLAAENSTSDQQPAPQYSKLPPLQLSDNPLMQKESFRPKHVQTTRPDKKASGQNLAASEPPSSYVAAQKSPWTTEDYIRAALSGAAGGLISGFVALIIGWMNNKNALKLNQQKINADQQTLEASHKKQIEKLCYEEKRKLCTELLAELSEFTLINGTFDLGKVTQLFVMTPLICGFKYRDHARQYISIICNDNILKKSYIDYKIHSKPPEEQTEHLARVRQYINFYNVFVAITLKMLAGEELPPPPKWNLDDFEGSVPLDYRKLIS